MPPQNKKSQKKSDYQKNGYTKLPFYSPKPTKADKAQMLEKLRNGSVSLTHLDEIIGENDWLKLRYDHDNGIWLLMHTYTPSEADEPIGIVSYRNKSLHKTLLLALWYADEISDSDFVSEEDDDF